METENIDSEAIKHIIHVLGSDRFTVMRGGEDLILKVYTTLFNNARASMRMCGMWTPKWEREKSVICLKITPKMDYKSTKIPRYKA